MRKHWFFDFDGTLCDTEADIKTAWKAAIHALGLTAPRFDAVYRTGPTLDQIAYKLFDDATPDLVERIRAQFKICYDQCGFPLTHPYPWIEPWLAELKSAGCAIYIATNKRFSPMGALMRKLNWEELFDGYYSFDMYPPERLKKSELLLRVMRQRNINAADAVMVGDTEVDVRAGGEAGLYTIACTWGYGFPDELKGADEIYDAARFLR